MMLESGIQQLVVADAGVEAVIEDRFYPVLVPENVQYPCATYQVISDVPEYMLGDLPGDLTGTEVARVQIDTWSGGVAGATYAQAKQAQYKIRAVLELFRGKLPGGTIVLGIFVSNATDCYEQDARCYRTSTDYMVTFLPGT